MRFYVRRMQPGDVPRVAVIDRLSFPTPWPPSSYFLELGRRDRAYYVLIAPLLSSAQPEPRWRRWLLTVGQSDDAPRIVGYVGLRVEGPSAHLSTVAIHPDWRRLGLGELLLLTAIEKAIGMGGRVITLEVRAYNSVAHRLYEKYGFRDRGVHRGYYSDGEDAWIMEAEVTAADYSQLIATMRRTLEERLLGRHIEVGQEDGDGL
jgi:ribosomal-protein-alanine N-acetyltransferase